LHLLFEAADIASHFFLLIGHLLLRLIGSTEIGQVFGGFHAPAAEAVGLGRERIGRTGAEALPHPIVEVLLLLS